MRDIDFFSWRREMLQQFQSIATGGEVYNLLQQQTEGLEYDYFALCVRHPVPFTRPRITLQSTYPQAWMTHYQAENYFAIDPVLRPENFLRAICRGMTDSSAIRRNCGMARGITG